MKTEYLPRELFALGDLTSPVVGHIAANTLSLTTYEFSNFKNSNLTMSRKPAEVAFKERNEFVTF